MLARLSSSDYPALNGSRRATMTIQYCVSRRNCGDARHSYFLPGAAGQRELSAHRDAAVLIDAVEPVDRLSTFAGVSASTYLAFTLTAAPGLPATPGTTAIKINAGTTVQSVPAQGQTRSIFKLPRIFWQAGLECASISDGIPWQPKRGKRASTCKGRLRSYSRDAFLIVGDERLENLLSTRWDVRISAPCRLIRSINEPRHMGGRARRSR